MAWDGSFDKRNGSDDPKDRETQKNQTQRYIEDPFCIFWYDWPPFYGEKMTKGIFDFEFFKILYKTK